MKDHPNLWKNSSLGNQYSCMLKKKITNPVYECLCLAFSISMVCHFLWIGSNKVFDRFLLFQVHSQVASNGSQLCESPNTPSRPGSGQQYTTASMSLDLCPRLTVTGIKGIISVLLLLLFILCFY